MKDLQSLNTVSEFLKSGKFHDFQGVLDEEPPWLLRKIIPLLSGRVRFDVYAVDGLKELAQNCTIVYAMKVQKHI